MTEAKENRTRFGLNSFELKCIAVASMLTDHIGMMFFPDVTALRAIGRLAFPIFCFVLVEGFYHTHDIWRYLGRLGVFALISEIPFDLARSGTWMDPGHQNVFFTLFLGLAMLCGINMYGGLLQRILIVFVAVSFAALFSTDYGALGVLLILVYGVLREYKGPKLVLGAAWNFCFTSRIQYFGVSATLPIALYNGNKGPGLKWAFYIFYPAHLLILYGIKLLLA